MDRIENESSGLFCPGTADVFVRGKAFQDLETTGEVVSSDKVDQVGSELVVAVVVIAVDGGLLAHWSMGDWAWPGDARYRWLGRSDRSGGPGIERSSHHDFLAGQRIEYRSTSGAVRNAVEVGARGAFQTERSAPLP